MGDHHETCRQDLSGIEGRLRAAEAEAAQLADRLTSDAMALRSGHWGVSAELKDALNAFQDRVAVLRDTIAKAMNAMGIPSPSLATRQDLETALELIARAPTLQILDKARRLSHRDGVAMPALAVFHREIEQFRARLTGFDADPRVADDARALADGLHPLNALITLVDAQEELTDDQYTVLLERVEGGFGKPLAVAIMRKRLLFASDAETVVASRLTNQDAPTALSSSVEITEPSTDSPPTELSRSVEAALDDVASHEHASDAGAVPEKTPGKFLEDEAPVEAELPTELEELATETLPVGMEPPIAIKDPPEEQTRATDSSKKSGQRSRAAHLKQELSQSSNSEQTPTAAQQASPTTGELADGDASWQTAAAILARGDTADVMHPEEIESLTWLLMADHRFGVAHHLGVVAGRMLDAPRLVHLAELARLLALGPKARGPADEVIEAVRSAVEAVTHGLEYFKAPEDAPFQCLAFAASLHPTMAAPTTGAGQLLGFLDPSYLPEPYHSLLRMLVELTGSGVSPDLELLRGAQNLAAWEGQLEDLRERARDMLARGRQQDTFLYAPATAVWHRWHENGQPMALLLHFIIDDKRSRVEEARKHISDWSNSAYVEKQVHTTDRELRSSIPADIEARALRKFYERVGEILQLVQAWLNHLETEPSNNRDYRIQRIEALREKVLASLVGIDHADIVNGMLQASPVARRAAAQCFPGQISVFSGLFTDDALEGQTIPLVRHALNRELGLSSELLLTEEEWVPKGDDATLLPCLMALASAPPGDLPACFEKAFQRGCHDTTARIIECIRIEQPQCEAESLAKRRDDDLKARRYNLEKQVTALAISIEQAVVSDVISEEERLRLSAILQSIEPSTTTNFKRLDEKLRLVTETLNSARGRRLEALHEQIGLLRAEGSSPEALERVQFLLDSGDLATAGDCIEQLRLGEWDFRWMNRPLPFDEFFPKFVSECEEHFRESTGGFRPEDFKRGKSVGPIQTTDSSEAIELLTRWNKAKAGQPGAVDKLLRQLGFLEARVEGGDATRATFRSAALTSRNVCPLPEWGSVARGRYGLVCIRQRMADREILQAGVQQRQSTRVSGVVVLYFHRLGVKQRRELAAQARAIHARGVLVIDEYLLLFLCARPEGRLPLLISCACPFTQGEPYITTSGNLPPEMFFGREREIEAIVDRLGPNLVYGGRQLGKTVLLREVERRYDDSRNGMLVRYVDLNHHHLGTNRPGDDIWSIIAEIFAADALAQFSQGGHEAISKCLKTWLEERDDRRIVLLLDEADDFLLSEIERDDAYRNLQFMKKLMDDTGRRFKVVFSGLHNVQRSARDPNTPLAHLGEPICVGPLVRQGEGREAQRLVELPFHVLGYRFDPPELPLVVVSHANRYPSLIQVVCKALLQYVSNANTCSFDSRETPPFTITSNHLKTVMSQRELQSAIADRFHLTLRLDLRYRVIALSIALRCMDDPEVACVQGVELRAIREDALLYWPKGTVDVTSEGLSALLDEMVGLGILREVSPGRYTIRSVHVTRLLGRREDIEHMLLEATETEANPRYHTETFRRMYQANVWRRSPLTAQQETLLFKKSNGAAILFGEKASGLDDLLAALDAAKPDNAAIDVFKGVTELGTMESRLAKALASRDDGLLLVVVPHSVAWDIKWVQAAQKKLAPLTARERYARVLFLGESRHALAWARTSEDQRSELIPDAPALFQLKPWHDDLVRRWMLDAGFAPVNEPEGREAFYGATGYWGHLLTDCAEQIREIPDKWQEVVHAYRDGLTKEEVLRNFGFPDDALAPLAVLAELDEPTRVEDLRGLGDYSQVLAEQAVRWAELMGYVTAHPGGRWRVDNWLATWLKASDLSRG